jgi:hypothetical protein
MDKHIYAINIVITNRDKSARIHGLLVEAWKRGDLDDDCLGKIYTNRNGTANFIFESNSSAILTGTNILEVYIKIRDRDGFLIYSTKDEVRTLKPDTVLEYSIVLKEEVLARHFSRPLSWEAPLGRLVPEDKLSQIEEAISFIAPHVEPSREALLRAINDLRPPIDFFDNILQDAWLVLNGDSNALSRFSDILEIINAKKISKSMKSLERKSNVHLPKGLIPVDNIRLLLMAAFHAGGGDKTRSILYLKIILSQLSEYHMLEKLHRASVNAQIGSEREKEHHRNILYCGAGFGFGEDGFDFGDFIPPGGIEIPDQEGEFGDFEFPGGQIIIPDPRHEVGEVTFELEKAGLPELSPCEKEMLAKLFPIEAFTVTEIIPLSACAGEEIKIKGSGFGAFLGGLLGLISGKVCFRESGSYMYEYPIQITPMTWSDTEITVKVPNNAGLGLRVLPPPKTAYICGKFIDMHKIGFYKAEFEGSSPEIIYFDESHFYSGFIISPGDTLDISWMTSGADHVYIEIRDQNNNVIDKIDPAGKDGNWKSSKTNFNIKTILKIKIVAEGKCNPYNAEQIIEITIQQMPSLKILGSEVIQTIQHFDLVNSAQNNSIRLVANKRTLVRVYVDSGITNNFDSGAGPNNYANVTGELMVSAKSTLTIQPLNAGQVVTARPPAQIDRGDLTHTLNFELPLQYLSGNIEILPSVWMQGDKVYGTHQGALIKLDFQPRRNQNLVKIRVQDDNLQLAAPSDADYDTSLQGARTRYPISEDGFIIYIAPGHQVVTTTRNLAAALQNGDPDPGPWTDLLDDIEDFTDDFQDIGQIWTAIVPNNYILPNGMSTNGIAISQSKVLAARATLQATFAHELGHTFGILHAPCGLPAGQTPDSRLPANTEDIGLDVPRRFLIPAQTSELMSYCRPSWGTFQDRWPSIAFWNIIYEALK